MWRQNSGSKVMLLFPFGLLCFSYNFPIFGEYFPYILGLTYKIEAQNLL